MLILGAWGALSFIGSSSAFVPAVLPTRTAPLLPLRTAPISARVPRIRLAASVVPAMAEKDSPLEAGRETPSTRLLHPPVDKTWKGILEFEWVKVLPLTVWREELGVQEVKVWRRDRGYMSLALQQVKGCSTCSSLSVVLETWFED